MTSRIEVWDEPVVKQTVYSLAIDHRDLIDPSEKLTRMLHAIKDFFEGGACGESTFDGPCTKPAGHGGGHFHSPSSPTIANPFGDNDESISS